MTRQEASKVIKDGLEDMSLDFADEEQYEALTMAIKALEQEPCIQEKQANADKIDAVYIDGFEAGYSQARFDLEQEPCDKYLKEIDHLRKYISKLETQIVEQEPSGDLISREDTLTAFADYVGSGMSMDDFDALWNIVTKMPSVKQEPKEGHWILTDDDYVYCSECEDSYYPRPIDASWYYCPHCGAKMESEEQ